MAYRRDDRDGSRHGTRDLRDLRGDLHPANGIQGSLALPALPRRQTEEPNRERPRGGQPDHGQRRNLTPFGLTSDQGRTKRTDVELMVPR